MKRWHSQLEIVGMVITLLLLIIIGLYGSKKDKTYTKEVIVTDTVYKEQKINLGRLDSIEEILYYEVIDQELYLYTKSDSVRDEIERWNYIRSLDPEGWEE
jgi:hypothetical protein